MKGIEHFTDIDAWEERLRAQLERNEIGVVEIETGRKRAQTIMEVEPVHLLASVIKSLCSKPLDGFTISSGSRLSLS